MGLVRLVVGSVRAQAMSGSNGGAATAPAGSARAVFPDLSEVQLLADDKPHQIHPVIDMLDLKPQG